MLGFEGTVQQFALTDKIASSVCAPFWLIFFVLSTLATRSLRRRQDVPRSTFRLLMSMTAIIVIMMLAILATGIVQVYSINRAADAITARDTLSPEDTGGYEQLKHKYLVNIIRNNWANTVRRIISFFLILLLDNVMAYRCYLVLDNLLLLIIPASISVTTTSMGIAGEIHSFLAVTRPSVTWTAMNFIFYPGSLVVNIITTGTIAVRLITHTVRSRRETPESETPISRAAKIFVESAALQLIVLMFATITAFSSGVRFASAILFDIAEFITPSVMGISYCLLMIRAGSKKTVTAQSIRTHDIVFQSHSGVDTLTSPISHHTDPEFDDTPRDKEGTDPVVLHQTMLNDERKDAR